MIPMKTNNSAILGLALLSTIAFGGGLAIAGDLSLDWWTIDGGGGTSVGGDFELSATIGQPDAGAMSGGGFEIEGGFWSVVTAIQTPGAPILQITHESTSRVKVGWPRPAAAWLLQQSHQLGSGGGWTQVPVDQYQTNATTIYVVAPAGSGSTFYRLYRP